MRKRASEIQAELKQRSADLEAGTITAAEFKEFIPKLVAEGEDIKSTLDLHAKAAKYAGSADGAVVERKSVEVPLRDLEEAVPMTRPEYDREFAAMKSFASNKRQGQFAFELGMKSQGDTGMMGENAYGTTAGTQIAPGQYFLPGTAGPDIEPTFIPGILELRWYNNVVASLIPTFPTDSPVITYVRETQWSNQSAATNEGQTFPYSTNTIVRLNAQVGKVANAIKLTDEEVQDSRYFLALAEKRAAQGVSRQEEVQILAGSGFPGVEGLLQLTSAFQLPQTVTPVTNLVWPASGTPGLGALPATISSVTPGRAILGSGSASPSGQQLAIAMFAMLTDIRVGTFFEPTAFLMNPADYFTLRTWTDANGQFMAGSPWSYDYGNPQQSQPIDIQATMEGQIWGKRIAVTPAIPAGYILTGDFENGTSLIRRGGLRIEMVNTNVDDFEKGLWTMRAYTRVGLAVLRPEVFELAQLQNGSGTPVA
jgi:HK97 family phage major capsid protein